jgi:hypothetical protein
VKRREFIGGSAAILADMISQRAGAAAAWRILKTAKAIGVTIPTSLLVVADG